MTHQMTVTSLPIYLRRDNNVFKIIRRALNVWEFTVFSLRYSGDKNDYINRSPKHDLLRWNKAGGVFVVLSVRCEHSQPSKPSLVNVASSHAPRWLLLENNAIRENMKWSFHASSPMVKKKPVQPKSVLYDRLTRHSTINPLKVCSAADWIG